eukprot:PhF_6_TR25178/c0_g3_i3/m.34723
MSEVLLPWPQPKRRLRSLQRVYPEVLHIMWEYVHELDTLFALYGTCRAWRERVLPLPQWNVYYECVKEIRPHVCYTEVTTFTPTVIHEIFSPFIGSLRYYNRGTLNRSFLQDKFLLYLLLKRMRVCSQKYYEVREYYYENIVEDHLCINGLEEEGITDRQLGMRCVGLFGQILQYMSLTLRDDRNIVIAAVRNWGLSLEFASDRLRNDREIALIAVKSHGDA